MTTATETITAAYREGNLLSINATPTTAQQTEGLSLLNNILLAAIGSEVGEELCDLNVGGSYDQAYHLSEFVPADIRMVLNLSSAQTCRLHPTPYDGQRLAVADAKRNLSTYNLTLDGNGRTIEGSTTLALSTDGMNRQWIYRADLGDWKKITDLILTDDIPFPREFDDYFAILLSMRLNPRYGKELQVTSAQWLEEQARKLDARYRRPRPVQDWGSPGLLGQRGRGYGSSSTSFARGRVW